MLLSVTQIAIWTSAGLLVWAAVCVLMNAFRPSLRKVPGPWMARCSPLWRVCFVWTGNAHERYRELHDRYGVIVRTAPNVVDISDPTTIPKIYGISSKFRKSDFYAAFDFVYDNANMENMFSTRNPALHQALKQPVSQKFSMTSIRNMETLVDPCTEIFVDAMTDSQGEVVDFGAWLQWYAFDVIGAITFNRRFGFMEERKDVNNVIHFIETGLKYGGVVGQVPVFHRFLLGNVTLKRAMSMMTGGYGDPFPVVLKMISESMEEYDAHNGDKTNRGDFLAYLRQQQDKTSNPMAPSHMMNHLMNNLLAGSDTTAISLRAVFYHLLKNTQTYEKLQKEIDDADQAGHLSPFITYAESLQLRYLQVVIKEALRMHPGVQYPLERVVPPDGVELCGATLPAGTIVGVNAAVIHRNTDIFGADANIFRPERWLDSDEDKVKLMDRNFLSFGYGTRTCIGKNISIMEIGKLVPTILREFDLEWASPEPDWRVNTYWFAKQTGLLVRMKRRRGIPVGAPVP